MPQGSRGVALPGRSASLVGQAGGRVRPNGDGVGGGEGAGEVGSRCALTALRAYRLTTPTICVIVLMQSYRRSDEAVRLRS